ncbi:MAG: hypothetical protein QOK16_953 [Solirubrobacteraceae bacterium]|nr:hypothetical protein [Solirubrobacteraceae bacterium]
MFDRYRAVAQDVAKLRTSFGENLAHEQPAVAVVRIGLAAHERQPMTSGAVDHAIYRCVEARLPCHLSVQRMALRVVVLTPVGSAAKRVAQEEIANPVVAESVLKLLSVELGDVARIRIGPDVDSEVDPLSAKQGDEPLKLVVRVPDRP